MLCGLEHSNLKPGKSHKADPKQKRHHHAPIHTGKHSGAVGWERWKGIGKKGKEEKEEKSHKHQTENLLLELRGKTALFCTQGSAESPAVVPDSALMGWVTCRVTGTESWKGVLHTCCWGQELSPTHPNTSSPEKSTSGLPLITTSLHLL